MLRKNTCKVITALIAVCAINQAAFTMDHNRNQDHRKRPQAADRQTPAKRQRPAKTNPAIAPKKGRCPFDTVAHNPTLLGHIASYLPASDFNSLKSTCKKYQASLGLASAVADKVARQLCQEFLDPINQVVIIADGNPTVTLYNSTVNTNLLINRLYEQGEILSASNFNYLQSPLGIQPSYAPNFPIAQAHLPAAIQSRPNEAFLCKNWHINHSTDEESAATVLQEGPFSVFSFPSNPLKMTFQSGGVYSADRITQLAALPLISLTFVDCEFSDGIAPLGLITSLRKLELKNCAVHGPLFPPQLCSALTNLTVFKANKCTHEDGTIPADINQLVYVKHLELMGTDATFSPATIPFCNHLKALAITKFKTSVGSDAECVEKLDFANFFRCLIVLQTKHVSKVQLQGLPNLQRLVLSCKDMKLSNIITNIKTVCHLKKLDLLKAGPSMHWTQLRQLSQIPLEYAVKPVKQQDNAPNNFIKLTQKELQKIVGLRGIIQAFDETITKLKKLGALDLHDSLMQQAFDQNPDIMRALSYLFKNHNLINNLHLSLFKKRRTGTMNLSEKSPSLCINIKDVLEFKLLSEATSTEECEQNLAVLSRYMGHLTEFNAFKEHAETIKVTILELVSNKDKRDQEKSSLSDLAAQLTENFSRSKNFEHVLMPYLSNLLSKHPLADKPGVIKHLCEQITADYMKNKLFCAITTGDLKDLTIALRMGANVNNVNCPPYTAHCFHTKYPDQEPLKIWLYHNLPILEILNRFRHVSWTNPETFFQAITLLLEHGANPFVGPHNLLAKLLSDFDEATQSFLVNNRLGGTRGILHDIITLHQHVQCNIDRIGRLMARINNKRQANLNEGFMLFHESQSPFANCNSQMGTTFPMFKFDPRLDQAAVFFEGLPLQTLLKTPALSIKQMQFIAENITELQHWLYNLDNIEQEVIDSETHVSEFMC